MGRQPAPHIPRKQYICRHCKVEVISKTNKKAVWTKEHKPGCPRRKMG